MPKYKKNTGINKPIISIVISVKNGVKTLQKCLDSIKIQSYKSLEVIVIDGNSNDGTLDIIKKNSGLITYWDSASDTGIYEAWNKALPHCSGDWIYFLGADDFLWHKNIMNEVSNNLSDLPSDILVAYGKVFLFDADGLPMGISGRPWALARKIFMDMMTLPHQGVFHRPKLFDNFGNFNESFKIAGDYELLLRYLKSNNPIFFPDLIIAGVRLGGLSNNPKNLLIVMREFRLARKINAISGVSFFWFYAVFKAYLRIFFLLFISQRRLNLIIKFFKGLNYPKKINKEYL